MRRLKQELYDALAQRVVISPLEICLTEAVTDPLTMLFPMREAGLLGKDMCFSGHGSLVRIHFIGAEPKVEHRCRAQSGAAPFKVADSGAAPMDV